jgi:acetyltransferase
MPALIPGPGSPSPAGGLSEAEKTRQAGGMTSGTEEAVGSSAFETVTIRPTGQADLAALGGFFADLSPRSRYLRFFGPVRPNPAQLRVLSGGGPNVDALVAVAGGVIIGHAMAADQPGSQGSRRPVPAPGPQEPAMTDIGVVVADTWQGRGVGSALVRALVTRARARGMTSMTMEVLHANPRVLAMIERRWPAAEIRRFRESATIHVRLPRPKRQPGCRSRWIDSRRGGVTAR